MTTPLDRACPTCGAPPGLPCRIDQLALTPRQYARSVTGHYHTRRTAQPCTTCRRPTTAADGVCDRHKVATGRGLK